MKHKIAQYISIIFHPIVFALLGPFLVIYHSTDNILYSLKWVGFSFFFIICTILVLLLFKPDDFLHDFDISKKEKRPLFYAISLFFAVIYFSIAVYVKGIFFPLSLVALGIVIGIVLFDIANIFLKVSIHAAVAWAFIISLGLLYGITVFLAVIWIPFAIIWSRLFLKKHTKAEVFGGSAIGSMITLITFAIAKLLL